MESISCDLCGCDLLGEDVRYVVKIQVYAAYDVQEITQADLDRDIRGEMNELIERIENDELADDEMHETVYKDLAFDFCVECQRRFLDSPLGKAAQTLEREVQAGGDQS